MLERKGWWTALAGAVLLISGPLWGAEISIEGGPMEPGFNSGTFAYIHATVHGLTGQPKRYVVFAEIQYYGTTANTSVEMDRLPEMKSGVEEFQVGWPIPPQAPTGLYTLTLHVEDRIQHSPEVRKKVRGFVVYKKLVRISRVTLDKTLYNVGEPIKCEVGLENLSDVDVKGLRVEFSNANYPWIALYSQGGHDNPDLAVRMMREHVDVPAGTAVTIPMMPAGTATFLQGKQRDVMGAGIALPNEKVPPPEVDMYTVALWNADRTKLYDMQFTPQVIVRSWDRDLPKPYSRNFTHPYNSFIDYTKYREFYPPGQISSMITVDHAVTLFRPGEAVTRKVTVKNTSEEIWKGAHVEVKVTDAQGRDRGGSQDFMPAQDYAPGQSQSASAVAWLVTPQEAPGLFSLKFSVVDSQGRTRATTTQEIAVNQLPASLLVICAHEDDDQAYTGLMRAAVEAGIPVHLLTLTAGDVGACERYFDKPCGPNEAREFGTVRLEETAEVLEHLGIPRDNLIDLGLPDGGSGAIWFEHKDSSNPFLSIYLACDHAPYENVYKPNLPYARDAVVEAIRQIITNLHPAMIALTGPDERHVDHRTANWFAIKACQELLKQKVLDPQTIVLADQVYGAGGFKPAPYKYENFVVHLSGEAAALRQEVTWIYQSQDGNLHEGDKMTFAELPREEKHLRIMDWQEHEGWNEQESGH
jgi:LmbE family N-acetylglucosaminyl deacetylase